MTVNAQSLVPRTTDQRQEILRFAQELFQKNPNWVTYFREVLGVSGIVRQNLAAVEDLVGFEQTDEYFEIHSMLAELRKQPPPAEQVTEPTRVITVRLPVSMHETLRVEAHDHRTSVNKLCISKLAQFIDTAFVPAHK